MIRTTFAIAAAAISLVPATAAALTETFPLPLLSGSAEAYYSDDPFGFGPGAFEFWLNDAQGTGSYTSNGTAPASASNIELRNTGLDVIGGALAWTGFEGSVPQEYISGSITDAMFALDTDPMGTDVIQLTLSELEGILAPAYGSRAILSLTGEFGDDPLGSGFGDFFSPVAVDYTLAKPVPLPASLPLAAAGLAVLAIVRRRAKTQA